MSSRPERTRISSFALLATTTCAALRKESRMQTTKATALHRKSGGAQWRDLRFTHPYTSAAVHNEPPLCHLDRSVPGFSTSRCWQRTRVRFSLRKPHDVDQRHGSPQEIRGSVVERSAVLRSFLGNVFRQCGLWAANNCFIPKLTSSSRPFCAAADELHLYDSTASPLAFIFVRRSFCTG